MHACFHCGDATDRIFSCPKVDCEMSPPFRAPLCDHWTCRLRGCPRCREQARSEDMTVISDTTSSSHGLTSQTTNARSLSRRNPMAEIHESNQELEGEADPQLNDMYLILLDMRFTIIDHRSEKTGTPPNDWYQVEEVFLRPYAAKLFVYLLDQQEAGLCRIGLCSTLSTDNADRAALKFLDGATSGTWAKQGRAVLKDTGSERSVWLFDESFGEKNPEAVHDRSKTNMLMKNLEIVLSEAEKLEQERLGRPGPRFTRELMLHIACADTQPGVHLDPASASNLLRVSKWSIKTGGPDCEMQVLMDYLDGIFSNRPPDVRKYVQTQSMDTHRR
ncbi:unnamed protein product [Symbiodinium microadriaticum]|nr:unnamed protein product [Symbiodinium microadriaticum]